MYVLAFDIGTSAIKSSLVSFTGEVAASASAEYGLTTARPGWAEQNPDDWWQGACRVSRILLDERRELRSQIAAVGVCGHMLGCLPVDAEGEALRPAMIHADARALAEMEDIGRALGREALYRRSGCILSVQNPLCKLLWVKRQAGDIYRRTAFFLQSKDYLTSKITGNINATDFSDVSHAQLIDIHTKTYLEDVFAELGLDAGKFPRIYRGTDVVGRVSKAAGEALGLGGGIPVIAGGGDGAAASAGAGITTKGGEVYGCIGTTAWLACNSPAPVVDPRSRVFDIMSLDGESFGVFGTMQAAGKCIEWASSLFGIENGRRFDEEAARSEPGSGGLLFLPYLDGERSPIFDANARGVFFNINAGHGRSEFCRAVLEGVSFALRSILEVYRESRPVADLRIIGGGAASPLWRQILADICEVNVWTTKAGSGSVTSLGVALAAAVGAGAYRSLDEAAASVALAEKTVPRPELFDRYGALFETYLRLYPQVKTLYAAAGNLPL